MLKFVVTAAVGAFTTAMVSAVPAPAQTADEGHALFVQRCSSCHSVASATTFGIAPSLKTVVGRKAATLPGFGYSDALRTSGITWTPETLSKFLAAPNKMVPRTNMTITVPDPKQRAAIIQFLTQVQK